MTIPSLPSFLIILGRFLMPRSSPPALAVPLGSLTQHGARGEATCAACRSERVTSLSMTLTDGTPVDFVSCHRCEHKTWRDASGVERSELAVDSVLSRARKL